MDGSHFEHAAERALFAGRRGATHVTFLCWDGGFSIRRDDELVSEWLLADVNAALDSYLRLVERAAPVTSAA